MRNLLDTKIKPGDAFAGVTVRSFNINRVMRQAAGHESANSGKNPQTPHDKVPEESQKFRDKLLRLFQF